MDKFGRKKMCMLTTLPFIASWLLLANATNVWHIYFARIISGFTGGIFKIKPNFSAFYLIVFFLGWTTVALVYVSEITHPNFRAMLLSMNSVFVSFGILLTCCLGCFILFSYLFVFNFNFFVGLWFEWKILSLIFCLLVVLTLISLWFIPESPHWLVTFRNENQSAAKSLRWLYTNNQLFESQHQKLIETKSRTTTTAETIDEKSPLLKMRTYFNIYKETIVYKPLILLLFLFLFQQLSGAYAIIFYAVDLFREIGGNFKEGMNEYVALVLLGMIRFVMAIISAVISKRVGRRPLLFVSGLGMCLSSLIAGIYMYLTVIPPDTFKTMNITKGQEDDNIPLYCMLGYVCFSSLGYLVIPWTLIGDLLPVKVRGKLGGVLVSVAYIFMFGVVKVFPTLLNFLKIQCLFFIFAVINLCGVCFVFFFLPETLGKSFSEIEQYFR